jgi:hypothetical protein
MTEPSGVAGGKADGLRIEGVEFDPTLMPRTFISWSKASVRAMLLTAVTVRDERLAASLQLDSAKQPNSPDWADVVAGVLARRPTAESLRRCSDDFTRLPSSGVVAAEMAETAAIAVEPSSLPDMRTQQPQRGHDGKLKPE